MITDLILVAAGLVMSLVIVVLALRLGRPRPVTRDDMDALIEATREPRPAPFDVDAWEEAWERQQRGDRL